MKCKLGPCFVLDGKFSSVRFDSRLVEEDGRKDVVIDIVSERGEIVASGIKLHQLQMIDRFITEAYDYRREQVLFIRKDRSDAPA
jgi:hypothetical protein